MRIEELILEGFKSYPVRTHIKGWDASFNAITGLNGSGKSNILDAICFVLGLTNMSQMRAQGLQDLVYKRGQAGITKASVTIIFDNTDKETSPIGLMDHPTVTVTRQFIMPNTNKYLLNGTRQQQAQIQSLFQSIQLNINNPNFLIMQGRITKVLNMRPQEILGMVEEAAGTRMFEERKAKAKKTMENKQKRVDEIQNLLREEITPALDKSRKEKRVFLEYQKDKQELEKVEKMLQAYDWSDCKKRAETTRGKRKTLGNQKLTFEETVETIQADIENAEEEKGKVEKQRKKESDKGGKVKKLEDEVTELGRHATKYRTQADLETNNIKDEEKTLATLNQELAQLTAAHEAKKDELAKYEIAYSTVKEKYTTLERSCSAAEELLQSLLTGLTTNKNSATGGGFLGQLADARQRIAQADAEEKQAKVKLEMKKKELAGLESRWKTVEREVNDGKKRSDKMEADLLAMRNKLGSSGWDEEKEKKEEETKRDLRNQLQRLHEKRELATRHAHNLDFQYTSPHQGFDRSKVKGLVATLIDLPEEHSNKSTALEIAAGGRLYNVVVEDERVGKDILERGQLKKRVTLIPLNKITSFRKSAERLKAANSLTPGKTRAALSLVGYSADVASAMSFVFGDTIVCDDSASANLVTFDKNSGGFKSVTLQGDVYDPSGTLSGGSAPSSSGILVKAQEIRKVNVAIAECERQMFAVEKREREGGGQLRAEWRGMKRDLEMKEHEAALLRDQVNGSSAAKIGQDIADAKKEIENLQAAVKAAKEKAASAEAEVGRLEKDMEEFKNNKEGKTEELKKSIMKQKADLQKHTVGVKTKQKEHQTAVLEADQIVQDIETQESQIESCKANVQKLKTNHVSLVASCNKADDALHKAEAKLAAEQAALSQYDEQINALEEAIKVKQTEVTSYEKKILGCEAEIGTAEKEERGLMQHVQELEEEFEWIAEESSRFGEKGGPYDFTTVNISQIQKKVDTLKQRLTTKKVKFHDSVLTKLDNMEKKEADNKKNLKTVLEDRGKITATIEELDRYKRDALQNTWGKVSEDFGAIFAELLPGNFAKLMPCEGKDLMDGLEVKVRLGQVWKQSLTELSGGQRSLIALSLIMALLQFKPAPMYILDEIDAALDLQHTQNIGQLFRTRFKGSQFIVVSLKEGLFTNANVLFKARFRDGTSIVERTAQRSSSSLYR